MLDSSSLIAGGPLLIVVEDGVNASNSEHLVFDMYACHSDSVGFISFLCFKGTESQSGHSLFACGY